MWTSTSQNSRAPNQDQLTPEPALSPSSCHSHSNTDSSNRTSPNSTPLSLLVMKKPSFNWLRMLFQTLPILWTQWLTTGTTGKTLPNKCGALSTGVWVTALRCAQAFKYWRCLSLKIKKIRLSILRCKLSWDNKRCTKPWSSTLPQLQMWTTPMPMQPSLKSRERLKPSQPESRMTQRRIPRIWLSLHKPMLILRSHCWLARLQLTHLQITFITQTWWQRRIQLSWLVSTRQWLILLQFQGKVIDLNSFHNVLILPIYQNVVRI